MKTAASLGACVVVTAGLVLAVSAGDDDERVEYPISWIEPVLIEENTLQVSLSARLLDGSCIKFDRLEVEEIDGELAVSAFGLKRERCFIARIGCNYTAWPVEVERRYETVTWPESLVGMSVRAPEPLCPSQDGDSIVLELES